MQQHELSDTILSNLDEALAADRLDLPTLPELALQIREVAEDPDVTALTLAAAIARDAGLVSRMIRIANSALYRGVNQTDSLELALSRIGLRPASNLALGMAMEQLFQATTDFVDRKLRLLWSQANDTANTCAILAKRYTRLRPDLGYLAGLTHSIGALPVLTWVEENPGQVRDSFTLERLIQQVHGQLGTRILQRWDFPDVIAIVPGAYLDFARSEHTVDYVDLVQVVVLEAFRGTGHPLGEIDRGSVVAYRNLGIDPEAESVLPAMA